MSSDNPSKLLLLWTTRDKTTALNMVFLYTINAKKHNWFDEVTLLIWGASPELVAVDEEIQAKIGEALDKGVRVIACKRCAETLDLVEKLEDLKVEVFYTGEFLSDWLKSGNSFLSV
ncbi:MAG: DsrE family protein [Anaerolineae bacterium]|nr:DsrE family protein [Anaerolineae bacterium]